MQRHFFRIYPPGGNPPNHWYFQFENLVNNMEKAKQQFAQNQDQQHFRDFLDSIKKVLTILHQHKDDAWGGDVIHYLADSGRRWQQVDNELTQGIQNNRPFEEVIQELIQTNDLKYLLNSVYRLLRHLSKDAPLTVKDIVDALTQEGLFKDIKKISASLVDITTAIQDMIQKLPQQVQQAAALDLDPVLKRLGEVDASLGNRLTNIESRLSNMANVDDIKNELEKLYTKLLAFADDCLVELLGKIKGLLPPEFIDRFKALETDLKDIKGWIAELHTLIPLLDKINLGWDELEKTVKQIAERNKDIEKKMEVFDERLTKIFVEMKGGVPKGPQGMINKDVYKRLVNYLYKNKDARGYVGILGEIIDKNNEPTIKKSKYISGVTSGTYTYLLKHAYLSLDAFFGPRGGIHVGSFPYREKFVELSKKDKVYGSGRGMSGMHYLPRLLYTQTSTMDTLQRLNLFLDNFKEVLKVLARANHAIGGYASDLSNAVNEAEKYGYTQGVVEKITRIFNLSTLPPMTHSLREHMEKALERLLGKEIGKEEESKDKKGEEHLGEDIKHAKGTLEQLIKSVNFNLKYPSTFEFYHKVVLGKEQTTNKLFKGGKQDIALAFARIIAMVEKDKETIKKKQNGQNLINDFESLVPQIKIRFKDIFENIYSDNGLIAKVTRSILGQPRFVQPFSKNRSEKTKIKAILKSFVKGDHVINREELENFVKNTHSNQLHQLINKIIELGHLLKKLNENMIEISKLP